MQVSAARERAHAFPYEGEKRTRGFAIPGETWYRKGVTPLLREALSDDTTLARPYSQRRPLQELLEGYLGGKQDDFTCPDRGIVRLVTLEPWHRMCIDAPRIEAPPRP